MFNNGTENIRSYLLNNFSTITFCRGFGTISSFILDATILSYFGLNWKTDAFFVAYTVPLLITSTLELQITNVLVPTITQWEKEKGKPDTFKHVNNFTTIFVLFLFFVSFLNAFFAYYIIPIQIPGLEQRVKDISINMSLILSWIIPVRGLSIIFNSILYTYHEYMYTSSMRLIINLVVIATIMLLGKYLDIYALVIGNLIGTIIHVVIIMYILSKYGYIYKPILKLKDEYVRKIFRLILYPLSGSVLSEGKVVFENYFASMFGSGVVSALRYSTRLIQSLSSILLSGVYSTILPLVSNFIAQNNYDFMKKSILKGIKIIIFISFPLSIWLVFCGKPLIILMFERGEFTRVDANLVSVLIAIMVPYILFSRIISIFQSPFFASMEMKIPVLSMLLSLIGHVLSIILLKDRIGIMGLALAYSTSTIITAIYMVVMFQRKFGELGWKTINPYISRISIVVGIMIIGFILSQNITSNLNFDSVYGKIMMLFIPTMVGGVIFMCSSFFIGLIDKSIIKEILFK